MRSGAFIFPRTSFLFCHFFRSLFEKSSAKTFIRESFREFSKQAQRSCAQCSHCTKGIVFCFAFFQKSEWGLGQRPISFSVFFLLAFSFALTVSKEKAVYGLDFVTIYGRFLKKAPQKLSYGKVLRSFQSELDDCKCYVRTNLIGSLREGAGAVGD